VLSVEWVTGPIFDWGNARFSTRAKYVNSAYMFGSQDENSPSRHVYFSIPMYL